MITFFVLQFVWYRKLKNWRLSIKQEFLIYVQCVVGTKSSFVDSVFVICLAFVITRISLSSWIDLHFRRDLVFTHIELVNLWTKLTNDEVDFVWICNQILISLKKEMRGVASYLKYVIDWKTNSPGRTDVHIVRFRLLAKLCVGEVIPALYNRMIAFDLRCIQTQNGKRI